MVAAGRVSLDQFVGAKQKRFWDRDAPAMALTIALSLRPLSAARVLLVPWGARTNFPPASPADRNRDADGDDSIIAGGIPRLRREPRERVDDGECLELAVGRELVMHKFERPARVDLGLDQGSARVLGLLSAALCACARSTLPRGRTDGCDWCLRGRPVPAPE